MRNFVVSMIVVFLVLCVPWFCVAHADDWQNRENYEVRQRIRELVAKSAQRADTARYCSNAMLYDAQHGECSRFTKWKEHNLCTKNFLNECMWRYR